MSNNLSVYNFATALYHHALSQPATKKTTAEHLRAAKKQKKESQETSRQ